MREHDVDIAIREALRPDPPLAESPGIREARRELLARIVAEPQKGPEPAHGADRGRRERFGGGLPRVRYLALGSAAATAAAVVLLAIGIGAGPAGSPAPALAANLRLTKVSPHVLLGARGWRIEGAIEAEGNRGSIRFSHGGRMSPYLGGRLFFSFEAAAELRWRSNSPPWRIHPPSAVRARKIEFLPVGEARALGAAARVFARTVPGNGRQYAAVWIQSGRYLKFRSYAPSLAAFKRRLASLHLVGGARWFHALPTHLIRHKDWGPTEAPARVTFKPFCDRALPPAFAAREDLPKVRLFRRACRLIRRF
jgi:hypothetical protein